MKKIYFIPILAIVLAFGFFAKADATMPMPILTATPASPTSISLNWTTSTSTGAISYHLYRNSTSTPIATTSLLNYTDTSLSPSTLYTYYVRAFDNLGNFSATSSNSTTTFADITAPTVPINFGGTAVSSSRINLNWSNSTDNVAVAGYKIYRNGGQIATSGINSFSDTNLTARTTYSYSVSAYDAANNVSGQSTSTDITTLKVNQTPTTTPVFSIELFNGGREDKKMINYKSNQKIRIVLFSDGSFNPSTVDTDSVSLSGAKPASWTVRKVNRDNINDFIFDFRSKDLKNVINGTSSIIFTVSTKTGQTAQKEFKFRVKNSPFKKQIQIIKKIENKINQNIKKAEDKIADMKNKLQQKIDANKNKIQNQMINKKQPMIISQNNSWNNKGHQADNKSKGGKGRDK